MIDLGKNIGFKVNTLMRIPVEAQVWHRSWILVSTTVSVSVTGSIFASVYWKVLND